MATTQTLRLNLIKAWATACAAEGIEPNAAFVVFGNTPEAEAYNKLALEFFGQMKDARRKSMRPDTRHKNRVPKVVR